jgi:hypothetical protein
MNIRERNRMGEKANLGGSFTFAGTSLTVNRMGYGAMQLAGQDGDKRVWGPPGNIPGAIAVLRGDRMLETPKSSPRPKVRPLSSAVNEI